MDSSASRLRGTSRVLAESEAASRTTPAAVIQERSGWGERKNGSPAKDVWLSSTSTKQSSQGFQTSSSIWSRPLIVWNRWIISAGDGGEPARIVTIATACSRRAKALYIEGRDVIKRARRIRAAGAPAKGQ